MLAMTKAYAPRLLSAGLRLMPMATKLALTLYMGRYFHLAEIGTYGLVVGAVAVLTALLGHRLDYVVTRDIVSVESTVALHRMRDQALFYAANYLVVLSVVVVLIATDATAIPPSTLIYVLMLTVLEGFGNLTASNMNSLNQQVAANVMFFIRSGLWVLPVLIQCALDPSMRTADTVLVGWIAGAAISLLATLWYWRNYPWRQVIFCALDWIWLRNAMRKSNPIWLGVAAMMGVSYVHRLIVLHYLDIDYVGAMTFYASFTNALLTLSESAVGIFAFPRLVAMYQRRNEEGFRQEARRALQQSAIGTGLIAIGIGFLVPIAVLHFSTHSILVTELWTFWLVLFGTWIRAIAEIQMRTLAARHQDRAVWLGNLIALAPEAVCSFLLVPLIGFSGVGYSVILTSVLLFLWRRYYINLPSQGN
jgi:O-antigen/teichoic acid export membrane protein